MSTHLVGLTGGIATGKSSVARRLRTLGATVIDADQIAREIVEPGEPVLAAIVEHFGADVLDRDGRLDRAGMRARITADAEARKALEGLTHPAIRTRTVERIAAAVQQGAPAVFVEAALLVETGGHALYPALWVVSCDPATQLERLMARDGMDEASARRLIATQLPLAEKEAHATTVVRNDGSLEALHAQVDAAWAELTGG